MIHASVLIRRCEARDLAALEWLSLHPREEILRVLARQERGEVTILLACMNDCPVGQIWIELASAAARSSARVLAFSVLQPLQSQGIGTALLLAADALVRQLGLRSIELRIGPDHAAARTVAERCGYAPAGGGEPAGMLRKDLHTTPAPAPDTRPIVCVDLNGVLDSYTGWQGAQHWDLPRPGAAAFLDRLRERGYCVLVHTTRYRRDAEQWLREHRLMERVAGVINHKAPAHVFVDDRAICFRGNFEATLKKIDAFQAHWEQATGSAAHAGADAGLPAHRATPTLPAEIQPPE